MYKESYINDFEESLYLIYLKDPKKLNQVKNAYLNQYTNQSEADYLAFKESLDHFVKKKLQTDPSFINSQEFINYLNYILQVSNEKRIQLNDHHYIHPELYTNTIFRDDKLRDIIFKKYLTPEQQKGFERQQIIAKNSIDTIFTKLQKGERVSQDIVNIAGDYIYSSRDVSNQKNEIYAKYIMNKSKDYHLKPSPQIIGAMTTVFASNYSLDDEVKDTRFFIAEKDSGRQVNKAHSHGSRKYCVFQFSETDKISLTDEKALFHSRTLKELDIYWLMFVSFHELTHQHQKLDAKKGNLTTSGISYTINNVLAKYMPTVYANNRVYTDYDTNHDSDEIEMEADEEGWRQTRRFIYENVDRENRYVIDENGKKQDKWFLAHGNERIVQARRVFSVKKNSQVAYNERNLPENQKSKGTYYAFYDIQNLQKVVKANPQIIKEYPILQRMFDSKGELKALDILKLDIYENSQEDSITRNSVNNAGLELGTYIINHKWNNVLSDIENGKIHSKQEIKQISDSIYHVVHDSVLKVRRFNEIALEEKKEGYRSIDPKQYEETKSRYDLFDKDNTKALYEYYFKCVVLGTKRFYEYREKIRAKYGITIDDEFKYYSSYVYELYNQLIDKNDQRCMNALEQFHLSGEPHLQEMYQTIMNSKKTYTDEDNKMM